MDPWVSRQATSSALSTGLLTTKELAVMSVRTIPDSRWRDHGAGVSCLRLGSADPSGVIGWFGRDNCADAREEPRSGVAAARLGLVPQLRSSAQGDCSLGKEKFLRRQGALALL